MKRDIDRMYTLTRREKILNALHVSAICAIAAVISAAIVGLAFAGFKFFGGY